MPYSYVGGTVFSPQEIFFYCVILFTGAVIAAGTIIFIGKKLLSKARKQSVHNGDTYIRSLMWGFACVAAAFVFVSVIPRMVKDNSSRHRQDTCAKEVGYSSPNEDNSASATAESQTAYRTCLDRL